MNRSLAAEIVVGIFIIAIGLLFLAKGMFGWGIGLSSASFWALVLIAIAVVSIINRGMHFFNLLLLAVGVWLFINDLGIIHGFSFLMLLAVALMALGLWIIINAILSLANGSNNISSDANDHINYSNAFSTCKISNVSKNFKGGRINSVFGQICIDLSQIEIQNDALIDISSTFGTVEIMLPRNVPYKASFTPIFGTFINNAPVVPPVPGMPCLVIKGSSLFGTCRLI